MGRETQGLLAEAIAGRTGALIVVVALALIVTLALWAATSFGRKATDRPTFDDRWFAVRQAAYFCLAVLLIGAALVAIPALGADTAEPSPSPSVEASQTEAPESDQPKNGAPESRAPESSTPEPAPAQSPPASGDGASPRT